MTNDNHTANDALSVQGDLAVVEAFVDGESVDAYALGQALADASARDHFVDLLVLRQSVVLTGPATIVDVARPRRPRSRAWWGAAAAVTLLSAFGGYLIGDGNRFTAASSPRGGTSVQVVIAPVAPSSAAPTPTQVIRLDDNWHVTEGK